MPLSRYLVRNEYGLADPDLYRDADKDDPEALLEGVAMAGLVGVLRQLGDLAEFAAEMFHDLHEEVLGTAARGHALIARVQQLEAEFPSAEITLLSQTSHIPFLYSSGNDWHPNIRMDEDLVTQGDMPRFVMDSYEECRGPPRLFLLDKFDVAGAGACLKRYTDPSFFKAESANFSIEKSEGQGEKRVRKVKRRGSQWKNGGTPEGFPSSNAKLHQLLLEERIETGAHDPQRRVKLKKRQLDGFKREEKLKSYMQKFTGSPDNKVGYEITLDLVPLNLESNCDTCQSGLEIVETDTYSPTREPFYRDKAAYSSFNMLEVVKPSVHELKPSVHELNEVIDGRTVEISGAHYEADVDNLPLCNKNVTNEELAADAVSNSGGSVGEYNADDIASEIDKYVDALATMESETETDSDYKTKQDRRYLNSSEENRQHNTLLDYHSVGNSSTSDDGSLLKKDVDSFSVSDNVSNFAEDATGEPTASPVNALVDAEKVITREAPGNIDEYVPSDDMDNIGKTLLVHSTKFTELPWISAALTKKSDEGIHQTDQESKEQVVPCAVPNGGYDHLMSVGISPMDEMANASSDSSSDISLGHAHLPKETSTHPQLENVRDGTLFIEMKSDSSARYPGRKLIHDLSQQVEATSYGLLVPHKPSVTVLNHPEPVYIPFKDNDSAPIAEEQSENQSHISGVVQDHGEPKGHLAEAPYVSMPNRLDFLEDGLHRFENETNISMVSMAAVDSELVEPMFSVAPDVNGIKEPGVLTASNIEYSSALIADRGSHVMEIHYPLEPWCYEASKCTGILKADTSEKEVAHFIDECSGCADSESTGEKANMNGDDSSILNHAADLSQVHNQPGQVSKISNDSVFFDGQMASNFLPEEGDALLFDDTAHGKDEAFSSETHSADSPSSVAVLDHAETKVASTKHSFLQVKNTETKRKSLSSVLDCSSTWHGQSVSSGEDPYKNNEGSQIQSLLCQAEVDVQNHVICGWDDCVSSDSTVFDNSVVLRLADKVHESCVSESTQTSLSQTSPVEAPLSFVEFDNHLVRTNSSQYHAVEDEEHIVDVSETHIALNEAIEMQGAEMPVESFNATEGAFQPLEYVDQVLPREDGGYESPHVKGESPSFSLLVSLPREPLVAEVPAPVTHHKLQSTWQAREQSPGYFSSNNVRPAKAQASLKVEYPRHTMDLSQVNLPLFGTPPNPTHIQPGEMPPLPPLPPMQWRLGRNQQTSLASEGLMQHPFGTRQRLDHSETSDNAGLRSQSSSGAPHLNPILPLSDEDLNFPYVTGYSEGYVQQSTCSTFSVPNMSHEDGQRSISLDHRQDAQIFTGSQNDLLVPASDTLMDKFSMEPLVSGLITDNATPELKEIAPLVMQYGHQLSRGFVAPEAQEMWSTNEFCTIKPEHVDGSLQKKLQRPRNPLIDAVVAVDKSKLRKVGEIVKLQDQPEAEKREQHLPQLRKVGERAKLQDTVKSEESFHNFAPLRKIGERVKHHDVPSAEDGAQHLPQLRKVEDRIKAQDEPKAEDEESYLSLRAVGGRLKLQDGPQPENKDWLEQIRNQSFNLKPPTTTTSRPSIQGRQTNLRVSAILEKANMIRQAIAGNDEDDSDGWSDS